MRWGRVYFAVQAVGGAVWWVGVFVSDVVRRATLGSLDPVLVAVFDVPLFVVASALAALGVRGTAVVATAWTLVAAGTPAPEALTGGFSWLFLGTAAVAALAALIAGFARRA